MAISPDSFNRVPRSTYPDPSKANQGLPRSGFMNKLAPRTEKTTALHGFPQTVPLTGGKIPFCTPISGAEDAHHSTSLNFIMRE